MKLFFLIFFLFSINIAKADILISVDNSMLIGTGTTGTTGLGTFDPFNPQANCNNFISPNSCNPVNRNQVDVNLVFFYEIALTGTDSSSTVDLSFMVDNGLGGTSGLFTNVLPPASLFNLDNQATGSFDLGFSIPLFGPNSQSNYGMSLIIEVTLNP